VLLGYDGCWKLCEDTMSMGVFSMCQPCRRFTNIVYGVSDIQGLVDGFRFSTCSWVAVELALDVNQSARQLQ
jgi:hypothetical protein